MKPFGIVMANWNKRLQVGGAIDSVLAQTDGDWRLAIVDDGSIDGSWDEISKRGDPRIIMARGPHHGPGWAFRTAVDLLLGGVELEMIGVLDSDDAIHPDAVRAVRSAHKERPEYGVIYTQNWRCDADLKPLEIGRARAIPEGETVLSLHDQEHVLRVNHWLAFTPQAYKATGGFAPISRHQDMDLIFKLEEVTGLFFVDEPLYYYRLTEEGLHTGRTVSDFAPAVKQIAHDRRKAAARLQ